MLKADKRKTKETALQDKDDTENLKRKWTRSWRAVRCLISQTTAKTVTAPLMKMNHLQNGLSVRIPLATSTPFHLQSPLVDNVSHYKLNVNPMAGAQPAITVKKIEGHAVFPRLFETTRERQRKQRRTMRSVMTQKTTRFRESERHALRFTLYRTTDGLRMRKSISWMNFRMNPLQIKRKMTTEGFIPYDPKVRL